MKVYPIPKPKKQKKRKRETDEEYLVFIRQQPCLIDKTTPSIAHHEDIAKSGGTAYKCSDRFTIPLSPERHRELHDTGRDTFAKKHNINYIKEIKRLQKMYTLSLKTS